MQSKPGATAIAFAGTPARSQVSLVFTIVNFFKALVIFLEPQSNWGAEIYGNWSMCFQQDGKFEAYDCGVLGSVKPEAETAHGAGCYEVSLQIFTANYLFHIFHILVQVLQRPVVPSSQLFAR